MEQKMIRSLKKDEFLLNKELKTLIDEAYHKIKQMIFQQKVIPGQKLIYRDLCEILKMSPTPIINALNRLEQEGFLISEAFRGFYVKPIDLKEALDLFGVREALETYAVEQAIHHRNDKEIRFLEEKFRIHECYRPNYYDRKKFVLDAEFHVQIAAMTRNQVLVNLLRMNLEHVYLRYRLESANPQRMGPAAQEHRKLIEGIRKKDIPGSIQLIRLHIQRARDNILPTLSEGESIHIHTTVRQK